MIYFVSTRTCENVKISRTVYTENMGCHIEYYADAFLGREYPSALLIIANSPRGIFTEQAFTPIQNFPTIQGRKTIQYLSTLYNYNSSQSTLIVICIIC